MREARKAYERSTSIGPPIGEQPISSRLGPADLTCDHDSPAQGNRAQSADRHRWAVNDGRRCRRRSRWLFTDTPPATRATAMCPLARGRNRVPELRHRTRRARRNPYEVDCRRDRAARSTMKKHIATSADYLIAKLEEQGMWSDGTPAK